MSAPFRLEPLDVRHDVASFTCGGKAVDEFIRGTAFVEQNLGLSSVFVAVDSSAPNQGPPASVQIIGFFSLGPTSIKVDPRLLTALGLKPPGYSNIGGYLLGQLGVERDRAGEGIGSALVLKALDYARNGKAGLGGVFLSVDAESESLVSWYEELGFTRLSGTRKLLRRL